MEKLEVWHLFTSPFGREGDPLGAGEGPVLDTETVQTALTDMQQQALTIRYQVAETNLASIRLADALDLARYFTMTHYFSA